MTRIAVTLHWDHSLSGVSHLCIDWSYYESASHYHRHTQMG